MYAGLDGTRGKGGEGEGVRWADADLTVRGLEQAESLKRGLERLVAQEGVVVPERFYVSPLRRAVRTAEGVWRGLVEETGEGKGNFRLTVKEGLREGIGIHTCDRRSTRKEILRVFPSVEIEEGFAEEDLLWSAGSEGAGRGTDEEVDGGFR